MANRKLLLALLGVAFLGVVAAYLPEDVEFSEFLVRYGKNYSPEEMIHRRINYYNSKETIARLNAEAQAKGRSTKYGINQFADMSPAEFKHTHMGYKPAKDKQITKTDIATDVSALPTSLDWRTKGAVTPVKDQGQCGSCWAFSATEGVESGWFLCGHKLVSLSPQQVVSCDPNDDGCNGGDLPTAFQYIQSAGLESEAAYPYTSGSGDDGRCKYDQSKVVANINGFSYATTTLNETQMQSVMTTKGPLSICVDAETWQYYTGGVVTSDCGTDLDHCVQVVGWNTYTDGTPYWTVRNSWSTQWGIAGYIYVERNQDECGIAMEATYITC